MEAASRLIRARGPAAVSVADVMGAVGMTIGGFYKHFESKQALMVEAIERASRSTTAVIEASEEHSLEQLVRSYLAVEHRDDPEHGCPVAALATEIGHEDDSARDAFERALLRLLEAIDRAVGPRKLDRERRLALVASLVGGLALARAVRDESLSQEILAAVRARATRR